MNTLVIDYCIYIYIYMLHRRCGSHTVTVEPSPEVAIELKSGLF